MITFFAGLGLLISIEIAVWLLACTIFISFESGMGAAVASLVFGVILFFSADINILTWAWANWSIVLYFAGLYLVIGLGWAIVKFIWKCRKARGKYIEDKNEFISKGRTAEEFIKQVKSSSGAKEGYAPKLSQNKENILFWGWWWPFSLIATFFDDFFRKLVDLSWTAVKDLFEGIRKAALGEAAKDLD